MMKDALLRNQVSGRFLDESWQLKEMNDKIK